MTLLIDIADRMNDVAEQMLGIAREMERYPYHIPWQMKVEELKLDSSMMDDWAAELREEIEDANR